MPILGTVASQFSGKSFTSFESIATAYGTGSSDTVIFSSIPSNYTHLQLRVTAWSSGGSAATLLFNNGGTYSYHFMYGVGSGTPGSAAGTSDSILRTAIRSGGNVANVYGAAIVDFLDYANTNKYKTIRSITGRDENGDGIVSLISGLYQSTSAISSIAITHNGSPGTYWTTDSSFALYGIKGT